MSKRGTPEGGESEEHDFNKKSRTLHNAEKSTKRSIQKEKLSLAELEVRRKKTLSNYLSTACQERRRREDFPDLSEKEKESAIQEVEKRVRQKFAATYRPMGLSTLQSQGTTDGNEEEESLRPGEEKTSPRAGSPGPDIVTTAPGQTSSNMPSRQDEAMDDVQQSDDARYMRKKNESMSAAEKNRFSTRLYEARRKRRSAADFESLSEEEKRLALHEAEKGFYRRERQKMDAANRDQSTWVPSLAPSMHHGQEDEVTESMSPLASFTKRHSQSTSGPLQENATHTNTAMHNPSERTRDSFNLTSSATPQIAANPSSADDALDFLATGLSTIRQSLEDAKTSLSKKEKELSAIKLQLEASDAERIQLEAEVKHHKATIADLEETKLVDETKIDKIKELELALAAEKRQSQSKTDRFRGLFDQVHEISCLISPREYDTGSERPEDHLRKPEDIVERLRNTTNALARVLENNQTKMVMYERDREEAVSAMEKVLEAFKDKRKTEAGKEEE